ncbi:MAG: OmpH family outer membrane protein [Pseudomonadota bacterium]
MSTTLNVLAKVLTAGLLLAILPMTAAAQGRVAVVDLEQAILQTDEAQNRVSALRETEDYKADKTELDRLNQEREELIKEVQNDIAIMSPDQQAAARKRLASKQADLEHVLRKLQQAEQVLGQELLQEMTPKVQAVLRDLIASEGIGLLIQRSAVIHADNGYSITAKVTDKLNQQAAEQ